MAVFSETRVELGVTGTLGPLMTHSNHLQVTLSNDGGQRLIFGNADSSAGVDTGYALYSLISDSATSVPYTEPGDVIVSCHVSDHALCKIITQLPGSWLPSSAAHQTRACC